MVRFRLASFSQIIFLSERYETEQNRREWGGGGGECGPAHVCAGTLDSPLFDHQHFVVEIVAFLRMFTVIHQIVLSCQLHRLRPSNRLFFFFFFF